MNICCFEVFCMIYDVINNGIKLHDCIRKKRVFEKN